MSESPRHMEREEIKGQYSPRDEQRGRSRSGERMPRRGSPEDRGLTSSGRDDNSNNCIYIAKLSR